MDLCYSDAQKEVGIKSASRPKEESCSLQKKIYVSPMLRVFGSIRNLTAGGGGTKVDGSNTRHWK